MKELMEKALLSPASRDASTLTVEAMKSGDDEVGFAWSPNGV